MSTITPRSTISKFMSPRHSKNNSGKSGEARTPRTGSLSSCSSLPPSSAGSGIAVTPRQGGGTFSRKKDIKDATIEELNKASFLLRLDLVDKLATAILMRGLKTEGVFRLSAPLSQLAPLYFQFNQAVSTIDVYAETVVTIAAALKQLFRSQQEPLIPFDLYDRFVDSFLGLREDDDVGAIEKEHLTASGRVQLVGVPKDNVDDEGVPRKISEMCLGCTRSSCTSCTEKGATAVVGGTDGEDVDHTTVNTRFGVGDVTVETTTPESEDCDDGDEKEDAEQNAKKLRLMLACVNALPPESKPLFRCLLALLRAVADNSEVNKMTARNLGVVFGATLMRPKVESMEMFAKSSAQASLVEYLIEHAKDVLALLPEGVSSYRIFEAPPPLVHDDWDVLLTNAELLQYYQGETVLQADIDNDSLYRIKTGKFRVELSNGVQVATLKTGDIFGEMSFLGQRVTTAAVRADEDGVEVHKISVAFIQSVFCAESALFMKFYWRIAHNLAVRLSELHVKKKPDSARGKANSMREGSKANVVRKKPKVVRVFFKNNTFKTFPLTPNSSAAELHNSIVEKLKIAKPDKFELYEVTLDQEPIVLPSHIAMFNYIGAPDTKIFFCDSAKAITKRATRSTVRVVIKEYTCKFHKRHGRFYITQHNLAHFSKQIGLETKKVFPFTDIERVEKQGKHNVVLHLLSPTGVKRKKKKHYADLHPTFEFKSFATREEAFGVVESMWAHYRAGLTQEEVARRRTLTTSTVSAATLVSTTPRQATPGRSPNSGGDVLNNDGDCGGCDEGGEGGAFPPPLQPRLSNPNLHTTGGNMNNSGGTLSGTNTPSPIAPGSGGNLSLSSTQDQAQLIKMAREQVRETWGQKSSNDITDDTLTENDSDGEDQDLLFRAVCIKTFVSHAGDDEFEMSVKEKDIVLVTHKESQDWWYGQCGEREGRFPANCVEVVADEQSLMEAGMDGGGHGLLQQHSSLEDGSFLEKRVGLPSAVDWEIMLLGGTEMQFKRGDVILKQGDRFQRIYQVCDGECRIEKTWTDEDGTPRQKELGIMGADETFGEISFLLGGGATASVIASSDDVEIFMIEAEFLKRLFNSDPGLAGRFFTYLSVLLERRLRPRS
eukprot:TRINITY_DN4411_c0_g1_i1.p1 TRINITY_DN4411_c0_g1~~TRINITY_DN4411_c0_g1_i1.p1  ORF type:complete len:1113 (+),score=294.82 TRINITY_DN4411_c0_g1_i1:230-3568(+)